MKHFKCNDFRNPIIAWLLQYNFNIEHFIEAVLNAEIELS